MRRRFRSPFLIILLASAMFPAPARAQFLNESRSWEVCGGVNMFFCAYIQADLVAPSLLTFRVLNLSGLGGSYGGSVLMGIGLGGLPYALGYSPWDPYTTSGPTNQPLGSIPAWSAREDMPTGTLDPHTTLIASPSNLVSANDLYDGIASSCGLQLAADPSIDLFVSPKCGSTGLVYDQPYVQTASAMSDTTVITLSEDFGISEIPSGGLANAELFLYARDIADPTRSSFCSTGDGTCASVTPEPATLLLLATGLLGLAGVVGWRRRANET